MPVVDNISQSTSLSLNDTSPPWVLGYWKFRKHRLAWISAWVIIALYVMAACCEVDAPYVLEHRNVADAYAPSQRLHWR